MAPEEVPLRTIADEVGTPCYVYSLATLRRHYRVFDEAFGGHMGSSINLLNVTKAIAAFERGEFPVLVASSVGEEGIDIPSVDLVVFYPAYIGDFASNGYLLPLDSYIKKNNPHLNDVITAFRKLYLGWAGKTYALPEDGDVHIFIYRKDLLNNPAEQAAFRAAMEAGMQVGARAG